VNFSRAILAGLGIASYFAFVYGGNSPELNQQKKPVSFLFRRHCRTGGQQQGPLAIGTVVSHQLSAISPHHYLSLKTDD
jgi:hypothetical protein